MSQDQFANLFSSVVQKKQDTSKLSLAERQKLGLGNGSTNKPQVGNNQWGDFDLLSRSVSRQTNSSTKPQTPISNNSSDLFEGFDVLNSAPAPKVQAPIPQHSQNIDLFEGFPSYENKSNLLDSFGLDDFSPSSSSVSQSQTPVSHSNNNPTQASVDQDINDLFSVFDKPAQPKVHDVQIPAPQHPSRTPDAIRQEQHQRQRPKLTPTTNNEASDEAVASLIDMGFSIEQATEALRHTSNGIDVEEAINYIMNAAHNKSRAKAGLPAERHRTPSDHSKNGTEQYLQSFGSLVSSVTDKVVYDLSHRFFTPPPDDGRPAWMRDQAKYKARAKQYDQEPEELTREDLERLTINNSHKEHGPKPPAPRKQSISKPQLPTHHAKPSVPTPEPEVDLFSSPAPSNPPVSISEPKIDLFSSPAPPKPQAFNNDEMRTSSRRRTGTANRQTSPVKITRVSIPINATQLDFFNDSREQGGIAFKNGDFSTALTHYQTALNSLPEKHLLRIIAYSNVITAYYKVGENKRVVELSNEALELIGPSRGVSEDVESGKPMKDFWIKITQRKAEALENLEKFNDALTTWNELIENGSANRISLEGKRRCQNVINPPPKSAPVSSKQSSNTKPKPKPSSSSSPDNSDAVKRIRETNAANANFEEEKFKLYDEIENKVNSWKTGKEDNLRALLASLQNILWESSNWKTVTMADLVIPKKVKIVYMKAVAKVHPDKLPQNATSEQKLIAQSVFVVINQAWETFKSQNGIQ